LAQLCEHCLEQAAFAEGMTTNGAHGLPERFPTDRTSKISKVWIINMLAQFAEKLLWGF
jgi:hypothetical protein